MDAVTWAQEFVTTIYWVYFALIFAYIITSWIQLPYNVWLTRLQRFLYDVVEPYLRLFRRFLPMLRMGMLDLTPIVAILALTVVRIVIVSALEYLR